MLRKLDGLLNGITMYRLVAYGLGLLVLVSMVFSVTGLVGQTTTSLLASFGLLMTTGFLANFAFGKIWQVPTNAESGLITALILFFIMQPPTDTVGYLTVALAGVLGMASKFMIAYHGKHIFNPAAFAAATLGLAGITYAGWWVGSGALWPFTLVLGLLIVRKLRKGHVFATFALVSIVVASVVGLQREVPVTEMLDLLITSSPLIFLGTIMLTEPSTMPPIKRQQIIFAALVATLYAGQIKIGNMYMYPELALLIGNVYAFAVSPKRRWQLTLSRVEQISDRLRNYVFTPDYPMQFAAGQYMDWTLPHAKMDDRGNRRTFTIASSPTEDEVYLGVKFYDPTSSYKRALHDMKPGDSMFAGQVAGSFLLPKDITEKLLFVAGGIGITPFRSMVQQMIDTNTVRDVVLVYAVSDSSELAYKQVFIQAAAKGMRIVPINGTALSAQLLTERVPDIASRRAYVSGPNAMVQSAKKQLTAAGVSRRRVVCDYFSGY